MLRCLGSKNFPPFGEFRMDFPPVENKPDDLGEVHLLTGVNGTGKTRLLSVLAAMLGNPLPLQKRMQGSVAPTEIFAIDSALPQQGPPGSSNWSVIHCFADGSGWSRGGAFIQWAKEIPAFAYNGAAYITDTPIAVMAGMPKPDRRACLSFNRPEDQSKQLIQAIANLKLQSAMDAMDEGAGSKPKLGPTRLVKAVESSLGEITGRKFRFHVASYPNPALSAVWGDTKLPFDLLPDGLRSIVGWLVHAVVMMDVWLQGNSDPLQTEAVFLLDEIESHLHPAWQRRILPAFQRLFPKAQIFVATHSPFLIASLNHGWIHPLTLADDGVAKVEKPVPASPGDSYISVVEDIMGLKEWYDPETEKLLADFRTKRDAAYQGDVSAQKRARELATQVGQRSMELEYIMGRELSQMDRQLAMAVGAK